MFLCISYVSSQVCGNNTASGVRPRSILIDSNTTSEPQLQQPVCQNTSREALRTQSEDAKMSTIRGQRRAPMKKRENNSKKYLVNLILNLIRKKRNIDKLLREKTTGEE